MLNDQACWDAVENRKADPSFYYGVLTTGVYCRPDCKSRLPRRENVRFYESPAAAEADGLRACLRCYPKGKDAGSAADKVRQVCRLIEANPDEALRLEDLSQRVGMSPFHLQRSFRAVVGVSPKQYLDQVRMERFKQTLRDDQEGGVTRAIFDAGYGSLSRLYEKLDARLGMTPMEYRGGGAGVEITHGIRDTPLGLLMVGATDRGLCFVQFGESEAALAGELRRQYPKALIRPMADPAPPLFAEWMERLNAFLTGKRPDLRLPVHVRATAFQLMVWQYLQTIPAGRVASYQEVAQGIGQPKATRAVARACASNSVALVIPCHRVIRGTGEMGGYRWGAARKRTVLDMERQAVAPVTETTAQ